jgi:hypothetical protein
MARLICGEGLIIGRRLLPASVRRFSDGLTLKILDAVACDSRFTIFVCLGDLTAPGRVEQLEALWFYIPPGRSVGQTGNMVRCKCDVGPSLPSGKTSFGNMPIFSPISEKKGPNRPD